MPNNQSQSRKFCGSSDLRHTFAIVWLSRISEHSRLCCPAGGASRIRIAQLEALSVIEGSAFDSKGAPERKSKLWIGCLSRISSPHDLRNAAYSQRSLNAPCPAYDISMLISRSWNHLRAPGTASKAGGMTARLSLHDLTLPALQRTLDGLSPVHARALWRALYREAATGVNERAEFLPPLRRWIAAQLGQGGQFLSRCPRTHRRNRQQRRADAKISPAPR